MERPAEQRATSGEAAFRALYERELTFVWNTVRRLGVRRNDLEDLTHDVFLTAYRRLGDFDPARPVRPWLFGIAFRVANRYRDLARHRYEVAGVEEDRPDPGLAADERAALGEAEALLGRALEGVDLDQRAVFLLHDVEGQAMPEIAAALSVPLNTAYSRLRLAREAIREALRKARALEGNP